MDAVIGPVTEALKWPLAKFIKHIGYIYKYKENLKNLEDAEEELDARRKDASLFAQDNSRKLKDVGNTVGLWKSKADEMYKNAQENISRKNISCLNPWSRYSTSKNASKMAREINEKVRTAPDFGTAFDTPAPKIGANFDHAGFMEFKSRASVVDDVLEALKDDKVRMCSICGMGGTGKTTLAKMLIQRVEADTSFDKIVMVTVSEQPNFEKIQNEIIELLGLKIEESTMPARANKLHTWLTDNRMTLLILDDVWWQFKNEDFENIGIPVVSREGCKLLVTSRNEDECKAMGSRRNFPIKVLDDEEGWALFKHIAGKCIDDLNLQGTAREIAHKCGGLPMVILTLAAALKDKPKGVWKDSLLKLKKSNVVGISGMKKVYSRLQLSYDLLTDPEAKACFRLCCLFPEDFDIRIEYFVWYGKGLQLFKNVDKISETRDRVETIVDKLKKSFLLLDGKKDGCVKMHDVLRDFAISISSKDEHPYILGFEKVMEKWPETNQYENCSAISFRCDKINEHPLDLRCPKLELLQVLLDSNDHQVGLPSGIFEGLNALRVLVLKVPPLSQSLTMLKELRTLIIGETERWERVERVNNIGDLLGRQGDLKNLEILAISSCKPCDDFPVEIGVLCNLRYLHLGEVQFKYMAPGVLSQLVKLEELELTEWFDRWGCKEAKGERLNAGLDEIESLPLITRLKISVQEDSVLAEKLVNKLTKFTVNIGGGGARFSYDNSDATSVVNDVDASDVIANWMNVWVRKCERYQWSTVHNLENIMSLQKSSEDNIVFPQWKIIDIELCRHMEYLVDTIEEERIPSSFFSKLETLKLHDMDSLIEICPFSKIEEAPCFTNLSQIDIDTCRELEHVFPLSVARDLRLLQTISIYGCPAMEEIFYKVDGVDDAHDQVIASSSVQELSTPTVEMTTSATPSHELISCCPTSTSFVPSCLRRTSEKHPKMIMEENIAKVEKKAIIFPQLKTLELFSLYKLRILYDGNDAIELPSLEVLRVGNCDKMEGLSYGSLKAPRLKQIRIDTITYLVDQAAGEDLNAIVKKLVSCNKGSEYLFDTRREQIPSYYFSQFGSLTLHFMSNLREICTPFSKIEQPCFSNLSSIDIYGCHRLEHVFPLSVARDLRKLQTIIIRTSYAIAQIFYKLDGVLDETHDQILEESIAKDDQREVDNAAKTEAIIFTQLKTLDLGSLEQLKILYDGNHAIEMPSLEELRVDKCYKMEALSYGSLKAPRLKQIVINNIKYPVVQGEDLNALVKKNAPVYN